MGRTIVGRRALLGAGALALAVPVSKAEAAAAPVGVKNVKSFGAVGNGSTDDRAAIQAAVNSTAGANRGTIYFPEGTYRITGPITFEPANLNIAFVGAPGATILGNFSNYLLRRSVRSPISGIHSIENLRFLNSHATGRGIAFHSCVGAKITNCYISAWRGIETFNSQALTVDTCVFIAPAASTSSVGIMAGNATTVLNCDVTGYHQGIRHQNVGLVVHGGRYEVNTIGIAIGYDENGKGFQSSGFDISGLSMEANQTGILVGPGAAGKISACSISGGVSMAYGLRLISPQDVLVAGVSVGGSKGYRGAGIAIQSPTRTVLMGVASYSPTAWSLPANKSQLTFLQTNRP